MKKIERPKVSVYIASSIDGYIARENGGLDWLDPITPNSENYGYDDFLQSIDALILGRNTYETVLGFDCPWPYKGKRVVVISNTIQTVTPEAELFSGKACDLLAKLHNEGIKHIWVDGGITISRFLEEDLVDRLIVSVAPVILGSGIPLFNQMKKDQICKLISSESYQSGFVQLRYELG